MGRTISKISSATSFARQPAYQHRLSPITNPIGNLTQQNVSHSRSSHNTSNNSNNTNNSEIQEVDASDILRKQWGTTTTQSIIKHCTHLRLVNNKLLKHLCGPLLWEKGGVRILDVQKTRPIGIKDLDFLAYRYLRKENTNGTKTWSWDPKLVHNYRDVKNEFNLRVEEMPAPFKMLEYENLTLMEASQLLVYQFFDYKKTVTSITSHGSINVASNGKSYNSVEMLKYLVEFNTSKIRKLWPDIQGATIKDFRSMKQCEDMNKYASSSPPLQRQSDSNKLSPKDKKDIVKRNISQYTKYDSEHTSISQRSDEYAHGFNEDSDNIKSTGGCSQPIESDDNNYSLNQRNLESDSQESNDSENDIIDIDDNSYESEDTGNNAVRSKRRKLNNGKEKEVGTTLFEKKEKHLKKIEPLLKDTPEPLRSETIVCNIYIYIYLLY